MARTIVWTALLAVAVVAAGSPITLETMTNNVIDLASLTNGDSNKPPRPDDDTWGPNIAVITAPYCVGPTKETSGFKAGCEDSEYSGFDIFNVKWLEQGGARVVPVRYDLSKEELDKVFDSVNGVYFTGGNLALTENTTYFKTAKYLFDRAIKANDNGDYFPIWGTCMGFQLLHILAAEDYSVLTHGVFKSESVMMPLHFTKEALHSRMLAEAPYEVLYAMEHENVTVNWHHDGVYPEDFMSRPKVRDFFRVISLNYDQEHKWFLSTVEGRKYPVYGVQFHPEVVQWDWTKNALFINRSVRSIAVAQYLANFYVREARKNKHRFPSQEEEDKANVYQLEGIDMHNSYELYLVKHPKE